MTCAPLRAVRREPSGYHWSQQIWTPMFAVLGVEIREAEIAWREIKFFVVERVVGDVHFAVFAEEAAVGIEDRAGVVIDAGGAALK